MSYGRFGDVFCSGCFVALEYMVEDFRACTTLSCTFVLVCVNNLFFSSLFMIVMGGYGPMGCLSPIDTLSLRCVFKFAQLLQMDCVVNPLR
jgi:hypothetical protein